MLHKKYVIILVILFGLYSSCDKPKRLNFSIATNTVSNSIANDSTLEIRIKNSYNIKIDSLQLSLDGKKIESRLSLKSEKLGQKIIKAKIFYEQSFEIASKAITVVNGQRPKIYNYKIINTYPHDITSYTQGLEFHNGILYESTGQYGESKLRKVNYKTGEIIQDINLDNNFFGEGLSILNEKIYQLTWQEKRGFIYDLNSLERSGSFSYGQSQEGWGLCNDGKWLYKSDGTEFIWKLDPNTQIEKDYIQVYTNKGKLINLNELEWVEGKIYANRYLKSGVAIINPENGAIDAVIDLKELKNKVTQHPGLDVLNGMAYNEQTKTLFVTGKRWDKIFEIKVLKD